eukprot:1882623-Pleurochrysis_carterae.AAC.2
MASRRERRRAEHARRSLRGPRALKGTDTRTERQRRGRQLGRMSCWASQSEKDIEGRSRCSGRRKSEET